MPCKNTLIDLTGRFFVTAAKDGGLNNQGRIKGPLNPEKTLYLVCAYEWLAGAENGEYIVPLDDIARYFRLTADDVPSHNHYCQERQRKWSKPSEGDAEHVPQIGRPAYSLAHGPLTA